MDSDSVSEAFNNFEELRRSRIHLAVEFLGKYSKSENGSKEMMADIANILMIIGVSEELAKAPQGFVSGA